MTAPGWTDQQARDFDNYINYYLPPIMWRRIMGLEETLQILTPENYESDKKYLEIVDLPATYIQKYK